MPARYKSLTQPVGILFGAGDRILDPAAHGEALAAKLPGADLELIEGEGHMVLICSAERSATFIARMAKRVAGGRGQACTGRLECDDERRDRAVAPCRRDRRI